MTNFAAITAVLILFLVGCFQIALVLGFPLGEYAWGGKYRILPKKLRVSSVFSTLIYLLISILILESSNLIDLFDESNFFRYGMWAITVFFALGIFLNGISRSRKEKLVMTPIVTILTFLCLIISLNI